LNIQKLIITFITPNVWKIFPSRKIQTIQKFSYTEKDSGCRLLQYLVLIKDPDIKKELFQHVLEEFYHADLFADLAKQISVNYSNVSIPSREFQVTADSPYDDLLAAYAYAHIGEYSINKDFSSYNNKRFDRDIRAAFARVASDEGRHAESTDDVFIKLCNFDKNKARKIYFFATLKRKYELYSAFMKQVGEFQLTILLRGLYFILGVFIYKNLQSRLNFSSQAQLEILKNQISELKRIKV
jgi:hypothetical protein